MVHTHCPALSAALLALATLPAVATEAMPELSPEQKVAMEAMQAAGTPGEAHAMLAKTAGQYDLVIRSWQEPGAAPVEEKGTATRTVALGGRVIVEDVQSSMMGQPFTGHGMQGYDNVSGKYWGTWNDSMTTGVMVSEGTCDAQGACVFSGSWNDPVTKARVTARMTTKWTSATTEVFEMYAPGPDGAEMKMMEITYTRR